MDSRINNNRICKHLFITYVFEIGLGKTYNAFLMDCIMSCVIFFIFHFPTNSSHGFRDWWRVFIFAFITCIWVQCVCCLSSFFCHLSTILRCFCFCNSSLNLSINVDLLLGFVCCSLTCFVWTNLILLDIQLHLPACNTFQHIKEKQKKN